MIPPGYKGSSNGAQGSASVRHTCSQRLYAARTLSVRAPHARTASAHPDAPGCDAHHENMLCVALAKISAIKKASFEKFICSQFFVQAGFYLKRLFDSGRDKERCFANCRPAKYKLGSDRHPQNFRPASRGCSLAYLLRHRSVVDHASRSQERFPFC